MKKSELRKVNRHHLEEIRQHKAALDIERRKLLSLKDETERLRKRLNAATMGTPYRLYTDRFSKTAFSVHPSAKVEDIKEALQDYHSMYGDRNALYVLLPCGKQMRFEVRREFNPSVLAMDIHNTEHAMRKEKGHVCTSESWGNVVYSAVNKIAEELAKGPVKTKVAYDNLFNELLSNCAAVEINGTKFTKDETQKVWLDKAGNKVDGLAGSTFVDEFNEQGTGEAQRTKSRAELAEEVGLTEAEWKAWHNNPTLPENECTELRLIRNKVLIKQLRNRLHEFERREESQRDAMKAYHSAQSKISTLEEMNQNQNDQIKSHWKKIDEQAAEIVNLTATRDRWAKAARETDTEVTELKKDLQAALDRNKLKSIETLNGDMSLGQATYEAWVRHNTYGTIQPPWVGLSDAAQEGWEYVGRDVCSMQQDIAGKSHPLASAITGIALRLHAFMEYAMTPLSFEEICTLYGDPQADTPAAFMIGKTYKNPDVETAQEALDRMGIPVTITKETVITVTSPELEVTDGPPAEDAELKAIMDEVPCSTVSDSEVSSMDQSSTYDTTDQNEPLSSEEQVNDSDASPPSN